jgi:hypothetical protein
MQIYQMEPSKTVLMRIRTREIRSSHPGRYVLSVMIVKGVSKAKVILVDLTSDDMLLSRIKPCKC